MLALTVGWALRASTAARAKNGRKLSLVPSREAKSPLARSRSREMRVTSTSTTVVSWADTWSDSTIRRAMVLRSRDIFSVVPRLDADGEAAAAAGAAAVGACAAGAAGSGSGALAASAAASTSCLRMRPPMPVPVTVERSMPASAASLRTSGVT